MGIVRSRQQISAHQIANRIDKLFPPELRWSQDAMTSVLKIHTYLFRAKYHFYTWGRRIMLAAYDKYTTAGNRSRLTH